MRKKPLQVTLRATEPSRIELTVREHVQLDRLVQTEHGYVAERMGDLLRPGETHVALDRGLYCFKTLSEANLRVVCGGVEARIGNSDDKTKWPEPNGQGSEPPAPSGGRGDEPGGEPPRFTIE